MSNLWFLGIVQQEKTFDPKPAELLIVRYCFAPTRVINFIPTRNKTFKVKNGNHC